MVFLFPFLLGDPENFILANSLSTPAHIVPEWYFLFAYAILRSIPRKLGGVLALLLSVVVLFFPSWFVFTTKNLFKTRKIRKIHFFKGKSMTLIIQVLLWGFLGVFFVLTWIGGEVVEDPYIFIGQVFLVLYFLIFSLTTLR